MHAAGPWVVALQHHFVQAQPDQAARHRVGAVVQRVHRHLRAGLEANRLPNTFVPGRNLIFLTFAAAYAYRRGIEELVTGVAQTDYSGYPDCRQATIDALQLAIRLGMESGLVIHTPLMFRTKAETVHMAQALGALAAAWLAGHLAHARVARWAMPWSMAKTGSLSVSDRARPASRKLTW